MTTKTNTQDPGTLPEGILRFLVTGDLAQVAPAWMSLVGNLSKKTTGPHWVAMFHQHEAAVLACAQALRAPRPIFIERFEQELARKARYQ